MSDSLLFENSQSIKNQKVLINFRKTLPNLFRSAAPTLESTSLLQNFGMYM
jgi:hypothetical protein